MAGFHKMSTSDPMALKPLRDINDKYTAMGAKQEQELFKKLDTYYGTLDGDHRQAFDDYMKSAKPGSIMGHYHKQHAG